jgi:RsiW-degrading membrane proteinase PrsW (M82 family)
MEWYILFSIIFVIICYNLAKKKGKSTGWAIVGALLWGIFAVLYYALCAPKR